MTGHNGTRTHYRTCNLCEAMCGIAITLAGDTITAIEGDAADLFSRGHICPKATALQDVYADPDRLRTPLRRTSNGWQAIGWEEAFDLAAEHLQAVQAAHGADAVGIYLGNPNVHNLGSQLYGALLIKALRTRNRFTATSVDQLPHQFVQRQMYGHQLLFPIPDIDRSDYLLVIGANPLVSNGSLLTAGGIEPRLKALRRRGGRLVVIDPRRTATAQLADAHHFIRPGSDVWLLLALVHTLYAEQLVNPGRLAAFSDGIDTLRDLCAPYSPERVAQATGIAPEVTRQLARDLAAAPAGCVYGRIGTSIQSFGGLCNWLIQVLNILTGNLDRPGGTLFSTPAIDIVDEKRAGSQGRWRSRVRGLPEFGGELPVATLAEEILTPGDGQIRALVTVAGNPVLSTPNGRQLDTALAQLDFMLAIDIYLNETTRHADLILPPTTGLETSHYDITFHVLALRNTAKYSPPLFAPSAAQRHDWQIVQELARRLAPAIAGDPRMSATPEQLLDFGLRLGPYGRRGLSFETLAAEPHGIDFGPLEPRLPQRLFTPDKRIDLAPAIIVADLARAAAMLDAPQPADLPLRLIGRRDLRSNNSWMHNSRRLVKGKRRCTLLMHPEDAAARGLADAQPVRVRSRSGSVELPLQISADVMPGVVCMPHGWGHDRPGVRLAVAQSNAGVSINDLTDDMQIDALTGNAALNGVPVEVASL